MHKVTRFNELKKIIKQTGRVKITDDEIKSICHTCIEAGQRLYVYVHNKTELIFVTRSVSSNICKRKDFSKLISDLKDFNEKEIKELIKAIPKEPYGLLTEALTERLEELKARKRNLETVVEHIDEFGEKEVLNAEELDEEIEDEIMYRVRERVFNVKNELPLSETQLESIAGKFGLLRMEHIRDCMPEPYETCLAIGELEDIILETDIKANERYKEIIEEYARENQKENLDDLELVRRAYSAKLVAEAVVLREIVEVLI